MTKLAFVIPAHQRYELTRVCLRQLRRTCDELAGHGITATAVVVASDANLYTARELGFATVERANKPLGRKFNDGIEYASSPKHLGCDFVVPMGSDDWIDASWIAEALPTSPDVIAAHNDYVLVHHSGERASRCRISYPGGSGIRVVPTALFEGVRYRPAEDDRLRAIDTSIYLRLRRANGREPRISYVDRDPLQSVGFTSADEQLNDYDGQRAAFGRGDEIHDPWSYIAERYPAEAVAEMRELYAQRMVAV